MALRILAAARERDEPAQRDGVSLGYVHCTRCKGYARSLDRREYVCMVCGDVATAAVLLASYLRKAS